MSPAVAVARRVALRSLAAVLFVVPTVVLVSFVDRGADAWPAGTVLLLVGPVCVALGAAWGVAELVSEGAWAAGLELGYSPARLLRVVVLAGAVVGLLALLAPGPDEGTGIGETAPVPASVEQWWSDGAWTPVEPRWTRTPASLSTGELVGRLLAAPPTGAAWSVDRGELVRRAGWALGFFVAALGGALCGVTFAARRGGRGSVVRAAGAAFAIEGAWLVAVLAASAYASSMT